MSQVSSTSQASSPCVGLCTLDAAEHLCLGCGRSLGEIGRWGSLSEPERHAIMAILPARLAAPSGPGSRALAADGASGRG